MKTKTLTAVALVLATLPVMGWAQGAPMRPQMPQLDFATADADGSGGISAEEWSAYAQTLGQTMRAEALGRRADALITAADADGDGVLTRDELIAGYTALGDQRREARAEGRGQMRDGMRRERGDMMRGRDRDGGRCDHGERGGMRGHGERGGMHGHGERGDRGDRGAMRGDRGGMMEPGARAAQAFERIDFNGDGQIDAEELADAQRFMQRRAQMMDRMGQGQGQGQADN